MNPPGERTQHRAVLVFRLLQAAELVERAGEAVPCPGRVGMVRAELALADFLHGAVLRFSIRDPAGRL
jgi:hypothetical protein